MHGIKYYDFPKIAQALSYWKSQAYGKKSSKKQLFSRCNLGDTLFNIFILEDISNAQTMFPFLALSVRTKRRGKVIYIVYEREKLLRFGIR